MPVAGMTAMADAQCIRRLWRCQSRRLARSALFPLRLACYCAPSRAAALQEIRQASMSSFRRALALAAISGAALALAVPARADRIRNPTAVFAGLDKITGRIISFEVAIDETVQFGALQITPRV